MRDPAALLLLDDRGCRVPLQTLPLARWSDGSVKWLLLDFLLKPLSQGCTRWTLGHAPQGHDREHATSLVVKELPDAILIDTGAAAFSVNRKVLQPLAQVTIDGRDLLDDATTRTVLTDARGHQGIPRIAHVALEAKGPVRATLLLEGSFTGRARCRFVARLSFFAGTGLVRLCLTVHNPNRARHRGGLWDLGDAGSTFFRDLSVELGLRGSETPRFSWVTEPGQSPRSSVAGKLEIYQDSSGGDNWLSKNHVNRDGRIPCSFRGYRVRTADREELGLRASPLVSLQGPHGSLTVALPEFWQQFPKALEAEAGSLQVRLFPRQFGDLFELQGGEQKTHTVWFAYSGAVQGKGTGLDWVHQPARVHASPEWYAASGAVAPFALAPAAESPTPLDSYLAEVVGGEGSLAARREVIDEYGWRNFGEIYADHEAAYYQGPLPVISHYNNQYDAVLGTLLHFLRTADARWLDLCDPLARHVIDVDIYHTERDRASYNGGLFWFTDHYKTAGTCTHRTYSRDNCRPGDRSYGGGPSSAHNFTTGLLHHYYLTGNRDARDAVVGLADWVVRMEDGSQNVLGLLDPGPTGLASYTSQLDYHGPGRGCGNSVSALLDAWLITGERSYLDKAESLICRCIHPADDVASRNLLDVEQHWSYTVFLSALTRYLRIKAEAEDLDFMYAYARESLLAYARWMLDNEAPYFDHPEKLEFATEVWAAQELRKANVLRLAAAHAEEPLRSRLARRGDDLAERGWSDLLRFQSRLTARTVAIVMVEGLQDLACRAGPIVPMPRPSQAYQFGVPQVFVPQKHRVLAQLKTPGGLVRALLRLASPRAWLKGLALARRMV